MRYLVTLPGCAHHVEICATALFIDQNAGGVQLGHYIESQLQKGMHPLRIIWFLLNLMGLRLQKQPRSLAGSQKIKDTDRYDSSLYLHGKCIESRLDDGTFIPINCGTRVAKISEPI